MPLTVFNAATDAELDRFDAEHDHVFASPQAQERLGEHALATKVTIVPPVYFEGYHPDLIYLSKDGEKFKGPLGDYHSAIVFAAFRQGLGVDDAVRRFTAPTYQAAGYFDAWRPARLRLLSTFASAGLAIEDRFYAWCRSGPFMHTVNHPRISVLFDVAAAALRKNGLPVEAPVEIPDNLLRDTLFPVYPEIGAELGIAGSYRFRQPVQAERWASASLSRPPSRPTRPQAGRSSRARAMPASSAASSRRSTRTWAADVTNSYSSLPDHQFWRRAVARGESFALDPVVAPRFSIAPSDRVATAGSCFAQHISRSLRRIGFGYWVTEAAPAGLAPDEADRLGYGVFSCRFGNIYTTRQLVQLFDEAFGRQRDEAWLRSDGRFVDALRPRIEPDGYASPEDVATARTAHLAAVRRMFGAADVLVFTLGLTECWRSRVDGTVFPLAPGVEGGSYDPSTHEFTNLTVREVEDDLATFVSGLRKVNPTCRVVLTVSPVPLIATYEPRHVLVSTTYSKSVLRVAAQSAVDGFEGVDYFPSYEIVTGNHAGGRYFEDDLREVNALGVSHAMRVFLRHYAALPGEAGATDTPGQGDGRFVDSTVEPARRAEEVVCDEEAMEQVRA